MNKVLVLFRIFLIMLVAGCSSMDAQQTETAEAYFARAQELAKDGRSEEAVRKFEEVKNKFPYSKLAVEAELAAADVAFTNEDYAESQAAYTIFRDLHPNHPQIPFVIYRQGLSLYNQIPEALDRDIILAHDAILIFQELVNLYPNSEHVAEAKNKGLECKKKLAEKELYIANFYLKKQQWTSALGRLQGILKDHQGLGVEEKALARAVIAAKGAKKQDLYQSYSAQFAESFPHSNELKTASRAFLPN